MNISQIFTKAMSDCAEFQEAMRVLQPNVNGNIWLIGGFVFRTLAANLYGSSRPEVDLDFVVENMHTPLMLPAHWSESKNRYGNPKLIGPFSIDPVPLHTFHSITRRALEATIENYLTGTPLTIQSITYDISAKKITGNVGIKALQDKTVGVNNLQEALYAAEKKRQTLKQYIQDRTPKGFIAVF